MDYDLICSWLGLPPGGWPPDHYRLLGLEPGEANAEVIEQRVHDRLDCVRRYQMMHPEQATEAMNRLAQAFICLMEPLSKKAYDATLGIVPAPAQTTTEPSQPPPAEKLDWLYTPPVASPVESEPVKSGVPLAAPLAIRIPPPLPTTSVLNDAAIPPALRLPPPLPPLPPLPDEAETAAPPQAIPLTPPAVAPPAEPVDSVREAARSGPARRGIASKRALYHRISRTRHLIGVWTSLGKYINSPKRRLSRATDGPEMLHLLDEISTLLKKFPPLLGEAGQPGYLVLALTQVDTLKVFQSFSPHQREAIARDWRAGTKLLLAHRDFLREEVRALRKRSFRRQLLRAAWSLLIDQPGTVLFLLALVAINVALWRTYVRALWEKLFTP